jgi:hypothetical protein
MFKHTVSLPLEQIDYEMKWYTGGSVTFSALLTLNASV